MEDDEQDTPTTPPEAAGGPVLALEGPFYLTEYKVTLPDGTTLVVTRAGTSVPPADLNEIVAAAASVGVTLTRK